MPQAESNVSLARRIRHTVFGRPRDLQDRRLFHRLSLVPFLAWVGLGADGLSSSAYGPEEAFRALEDNTFLVPALALLMAGTVLLISAAYRRIIEEFPTGGGGYVVASKLLGSRAGLVSGAALLVDYVLTITISIAAAGDALFSLIGRQWQPAKLPVELALIVILTGLNIRGVRESVLALVPVFLLFIATHLLVILGGILGHMTQVPETFAAMQAGYQNGVVSLGIGGLLLVFVRAFSLGGGTYTGIEAVSNGLPIMREPKEETGKRTMTYMGISLAFTASGLLLCYLLWQLAPIPGQTMNAVLVNRLTGALPLGGVVVVLFLFSEATLLVVAAQAGFIDGPRVLANMAIDSWVPHRFAALSERLTTHNGIVLMGGAAVAALLYTRGNVSHLVVMYSINVFLTFTLSMFSMLYLWRNRRGQRFRKRRLILFGAGFALCLTILSITLLEKFTQGGWITVVITLSVIALCVLIRRHYDGARRQVELLYRELGDLPETLPADQPPLPLNKAAPTAAVLVDSFSGVGIHTVLNIFRAFHGHYKNLVFLSVGIVDSGEFKGEHAIEDLRRRTEHMLAQYVGLGTRLGVPATGKLAIGTEVVAEAESLCLATSQEFPQTTFFVGRMIFQKERWWHRFLHNQTTLAIQKRLNWAGKTLVAMPIRVREDQVHGGSSRAIHENSGSS